MLLKYDKHTWYFHRSHICLWEEPPPLTVTMALDYLLYWNWFFFPPEFPRHVFRRLWGPLGPIEALSKQNVRFILTQKKCKQLLFIEGILTMYLVLCTLYISSFQWLPARGGLAPRGHLARSWGILIVTAGMGRGGRAQGCCSMS